MWNGTKKQDYSARHILITFLLYLCQKLITCNPAWNTDSALLKSATRFIHLIVMEGSYRLTVHLTVYGIVFCLHNNLTHLQITIKHGCITHLLWGLWWRFLLASICRGLWSCQRRPIRPWGSASPFCRTGPWREWRIRCPWLLRTAEAANKNLDVDRGPGQSITLHAINFYLKRGSTNISGKWAIA